jgi:hypothetical protein
MLLPGVAAGHGWLHRYLSAAWWLMLLKEELLAHARQALEPLFMRDFSEGSGLPVRLPYPIIK